MNRTKFFLLLFVSLFFMSLASCGDDDVEYPLPPDELPYAAQSFLADFYDGVRIIDVDWEKDHDMVEYKVKLANGHEVTFDEAGGWIEIEAPSGKAIPYGIVPDIVYYYIDDYFPGQGINEISIEH